MTVYRGSHREHVPGLQAERAQLFWNDFYENNSSHPEWIVDSQACLLHVPNMSGASDCPPACLELGCGDGALAAALAWRGWRVLAVDVSPVSIHQARATHERVCGACTERAGSVRFEAADAMALPADLLQDFGARGGFQLIVEKGMSDTLDFRGRNNEKRSLLLRFFSSVYSMLAPGGQYLIVTPRARVRHLRTAAPWAEVTTGAIVAPIGLLDASALRSRASEDRRAMAYAHVARKGVDGAEEVPDESPAAGDDLSFWEPSSCVVCGCQRLPRYRSAQSWAKHMSFCGGSGSAVDDTNLSH